MAIHLKDVRYSYPSHPARFVLDVPSWSVEEGQSTFIHGPSGGGKSTLLNVLSGLLKAEGQVKVFGNSLNTMSTRLRDKFRATHIGFVFQQFNLIPYLNAVDNVRLASSFSSDYHRDSIQGDIGRMLTELNIPKDEWTQPARNLSIGQQQRIAIARALINKPRLLIADEPTSSLDQVNRDVFMSLLMNIVSEHNITLLFVSHDLGLSKYFGRVEPLDEINNVGAKT